MGFVFSVDIDRIDQRTRVVVSIVTLRRSL